MTYRSMIARYFSNACLLFATILVASSALAQATTGSISGHVTDPSGSVVRGAHVSVQDQDNGVITTESTNDSGEFTATALPPHHYTITVEQSGFANTTVPLFKLNIDHS